MSEPDAEPAFRSGTFPQARAGLSARRPTSGKPRRDSMGDRLASSTTFGIPLSAKRSRTPEGEELLPVGLSARRPTSGIARSAVGDTERRAIVRSTAFICDRRESLGSHWCGPHFPPVALGRSEVDRQVADITRYGCEAHGNTNWVGDTNCSANRPRRTADSAGGGGLCHGTSGARRPGDVVGLLRLWLLCRRGRRREQQRMALVLRRARRSEHTLRHLSGAHLVVLVLRMTRRPKHPGRKPVKWISRR